MRLNPPDPAARAFAALWSVLLELALAGLALLGGVAAFAPPQDLPWTPLRLSDPIGAATAFKIARLAGRPDACRQVLREGGVETVPGPTSTTAASAWWPRR